MRLICPSLSISGINHGFFTRQGGVSHGIYASLNCGYGSGDDIPTVAKNRERVAKELGLALPQLCTAYQVHSNLAVTLTTPWEWEDAEEVDALVTNKPGIGLGILTADCTPVLFADPKNRVIGAAHAGWKGAVSGIIEATLDAMQKCGADKKNIIACLGPCIAQNSYEVGAEFFARLMEISPENAEFFVPSKKLQHFMFNLPGYVESRLRAAGVAHINILARDTCLEEDDFFSYRRTCLRGDTTYGRQISAIALT